KQSQFRVTPPMVESVKNKEGRCRNEGRIMNTDASGLLVDHAGNRFALRFSQEAGGLRVRASKREARLRHEFLIVTDDFRRERAPAGSLVGQVMLSDREPVTNSVPLRIRRQAAARSRERRQRKEQLAACGVDPELGGRLPQETRPARPMTRARPPALAHDDAPSAPAIAKRFALEPSLDQLEVAQPMIGAREGRELPPLEEPGVYRRRVQ